MSAGSSRSGLSPSWDMSGGGQSYPIDCFHILNTLRRSVAKHQNMPSRLRPGAETSPVQSRGRSGQTGGVPFSQVKCLSTGISRGKTAAVPSRLSPPSLLFEHKDRGLTKWFEPSTRPEEHAICWSVFLRSGRYSQQRLRGLALYHGPLGGHSATI